MTDAVFVFISVLRGIACIRYTSLLIADCPTLHVSSTVVFVFATYFEVVVKKYFLLVRCDLF